MGGMPVETNDPEICLDTRLARLSRACRIDRQTFNNPTIQGSVMNTQRTAVAVAAFSVVCLLASGVAASSPPTYAQTYYFKNFDSLGDNGERAGVELDNQAFPNSVVQPAQLQSAASAFAALIPLGFGEGGSWHALGPTIGTVPGPVTFTGAPGTTSGRITSLVISPGCHASACTILAGAAGGGVWKTVNGLSSAPQWRSVSAGLPTNSIGSLLIDPTDSTGSTVYVGTGEPNGSGDSEAGLGLYKSTDAGEHWSLVPGSLAAAHDRGIGAIAVDPRDPRHIWIGTTIARHGLAAVSGGRYTPPNAPQIGLYESIDGGQTFLLAFSVVSDTVNPATATGSDFFRGGVGKISTYRLGEEDGAFTQIYFSVFDYGVYRSTRNHLFEQVFASAGGGAVAASSTSRTDFALARREDGLRIYVGDVGFANADFYRTDNANVPATALVTGGTNGGWTKLSNSTKGTPGFSSYNFCQGQCWYDIFVASPAGKPNTVWLGGSMQYGELFGPSNGRAVVRSVNAGVSFTDMTADTQTPVPNGMHPDQHAIAFVPGAPDIAVIGSDGGVVRTSGAFADASAGCASRGLSGANLADCQAWLSVIPTTITSLNPGLADLQFQGVAVNAQNPRNDVIGGTQDNGTWAYDGTTGNWFESIGGDGGPPAISAVTGFRMHSYTGVAIDVNFVGNQTFGWEWVGDPLNNSGEAAGFYSPLVSDPTVGGSWFAGMQHVWRTPDNGGDPAYLQTHCNEYFGDFAVTCGDWAPLGGPAGSNTAGDLVGTAYGVDKFGSYVVAIARGATAAAPLWIGTRRGRLFVSANPNASDPASVAFRRIDTAAQPQRFISGIAIDPRNPLRAFVSFVGYDAYTPATPGHVFQVVYDPKSGTAQWTDLSAGLGDQPITGIAYDGENHHLYAATDFGVLVRSEGSWRQAASGLPLVSVYQLVLDQGSHLLYAATHGRGVYRLEASD